MRFNNEEKILIKNLRDSAWNSLWDVFNDTRSSYKLCCVCVKAVKVLCCVCVKAVKVLCCVVYV